MKRTVKVRSGSGPSDVHVSAWHVPTRLIDDGQSIPNNVLSLLLKYDFCLSLLRNRTAYLQPLALTRSRPVLRAESVS